MADEDREEIGRREQRAASRLSARHVVNEGEALECKRRAQPADQRKPRDPEEAREEARQNGARQRRERQARQGGRRRKGQGRARRCEIATTLPASHRLIAKTKAKLQPMAKGTA